MLSRPSVCRSLACEKSAFERLSALLPFLCMLCLFGSRSLLRRCPVANKLQLHSTPNVAIAASLMALLSGMVKCSLVLPMLVSSLQHGVSPTGISVSKEQKADAWLTTRAARSSFINDSCKLKQNENYRMRRNGIMTCRLS